MSTPIYPIISGRVSDVLNRTRSLTQLQIDQSALNKLQSQLSSGHRISQPSDDPIAAVQIMALQRQQENQTQAISNLDSANGYLAVTENALSTLTDSLQQIKSLALDAATNVNSDGEREAIANQVKDQISRLLSVSNQTYLDRYLFSGGSVRQQPYSHSGDGVAFQADSLSLESIGLPGTMISHNVSGTDAFGGISSGIVGTADLSPQITPETRLSSLNDGFGVSKGSIQFSNGTQQIQVDLANAYRMEDVIDKLNTVSVGGRQISASLTNNGIQVDWADGGPGLLRISNVGVGTVATELGIESTAPVPTLPIIGNDMRNVLVPKSKLSELFDGAGLSNSGGIKITQGDKSFDISFAGAQTVEDVMVKIDNSGAKVKASIAPDGKRLQIQSVLSGVDFSISELNSNTASVLGLKTFNGSARLADLNHGQGIHQGEGNDLEFTRSDGTSLSIDLSSAITVDDVVSLINNHADNQDPALKITASVNQLGNGLVLDAPEPVLPAVGAPIKIRNAGGSQAAEGLGLVAKGQSESVATANAGVYTITGGDPNPQEVKGTFNSLIRLRDAIENNDIEALARISTEIDSDLSRVTLLRGRVGIEQQKIDTLKTTNEDQLLMAKDKQSELFDTDYAAVIAELSSKQVSYEASLQLLSNLMKGANLFSFL